MVDVKLYLGDCLGVMKTLPDGCVDMVFADPPYGHNNNNGDLIARWEAALGRGDYVPKRDDRPIANDGTEANDLFRDCLPELYRLLKTDSTICCCCCGGGGPDPQFARWSLWLDEVFRFKQMVVWDKGPMGMGWHYRRSYETILVAEKGRGKWCDNSRRIENIIRPGDYGISKIIPNKEQHPTQKPVELAEHFILLHTDPGDWVVDFVMGSGTTGVACVQTGRNFIGIEISEQYFKVAQKRIAEAQMQSRLPSVDRPQYEQIGMLDG